MEKVQKESESKIDKQKQDHLESMKDADLIKLVK